MELETLLQERKGGDPKQSYVAGMHAKGLDAILRKLAEEATETLLASRDLAADLTTKPALVHEAADLLFHLLLLLAHQNVSLDEVLAELAARQHRSGLEDAAAREF